MGYDYGLRFGLRRAVSASLLFGLRQAVSAFCISITMFSKRLERVLDVASDEVWNRKRPNFRFLPPGRRREVRLHAEHAVQRLVDMVLDGLQAGLGLLLDGPDRARALLLGRAVL